MRIAILGSIASIHVVRWANEFAKRGNDVFILSMHNSREPINESITVIKLPFRKPMGYIFNIPIVRRQLDFIKPDIVHAFYALGYGTMATFSKKTPHILSVMGSDVYDDIKNPLFSYLVKLNLRRADRVGSTSHAMLRQVQHLVPELVDPKIIVTSFGIDLNQFQPKQKPNNEESPFVVGTVKWMEYKYGIDILIHAFAKLVKRNPELNVVLRLVGDGSQTVKMIRLAEKLGISRKCEFLGFINHRDVPEVLHSFDIFVCLSRLDSESFGVAILEASSVGIPVIVSKYGGLPEVVQNEITGLVINNDDINSISIAIERLIYDKELRNKLGSAGRERVIKEYDWKASVNKMTNIYKELV